MSPAEDLQTNRSAIGAQVTVWDVGGTMILSGTQTLGGGAGRGGDTSRKMRFGLGAGAPYSVMIQTKWLHGFTQRDTVSVNQTVTIYDSTPPTIDDGSIVITTVLAPGEVRWAFEWYTDYEFMSCIDKVILNGPSTGWQDRVITQSNANYSLYHKRHFLGDYATGCSPGLHSIRVITNANGQERSADLTINVKFCARGY